MTDSETAAPPKAGLRELFSYLREHRGVLVIVLVISLVGAGLNLAVMSRDVVLAPARNDTVPIQEVSVQTACH